MKFTSVNAAALAVLVLIAPPALSEEVPLPEGVNGSVGSTVSPSLTTVSLRSGDQSWDLSVGDLIAKPNPGGDWAFHWGERSMVGTTCRNPGYVVAGFIKGKVRLGCYQGEIPAELK